MRLSLHSRMRHAYEKKKKIGHVAIHTTPDEKFGWEILQMTSREGMSDEDDVGGNENEDGDDDCGEGDEDSGSISAVSTATRCVHPTQ